MFEADGVVESSWVVSNTFKHTETLLKLEAKADLRSVCFVEPHVSLSAVQLFASMHDRCCNEQVDERTRFTISFVPIWMGWMMIALAVANLCAILKGNLRCLRC